MRFLLLLLLATSAQATTFYVRPDGGNASQCTGLVDAPVNATKACAWGHPFVPLPPQSFAAQIPKVLIKSGDTLIIGPGQYEIGLTSPYAAATPSACNSAWAYACNPAPIPSGTKVLGKGWDTGCTSPPQLRASERASPLVSLQNSNDVTVACLELTDHSNCIDQHNASSPSALKCKRDTPPFGPWGGTGISAVDSARVTLQDINIHGLAHDGVLAGRLKDWTLRRVRIYANGWSGWNGDTGSPSGSSNSGTMTLDHVEVGFNGCTENYPSTDIVGCWAQNEGGYGDGLGTGKTGGNWVVTDSNFHHNTSDGLDLLYMDGTGTTTVQRSRFEGNAGNQVKIAGAATLENSLVVGNCAYHEGKGLMQRGDLCRAAGNAVSWTPIGSGAATLRYDTITSQGDCAILAAGPKTAPLTIQNSIVLGQTDYTNSAGDEKTCFVYWDSNDSTPWPVKYSGDIVYNVKDACPAGQICVDPKLANPSLSAFNPGLLDGSPAIATAVTPPMVSTDLAGTVRGPRYDIGAFAYAGTVVVPPTGQTVCTTIANGFAMSVIGPCSCTATTCR